MVHYHMIITGKVQGVGFRYFAQMKAIQYEITGWVKNLPGGSVELVATGDKENINMFLEELRNGNPFAKVKDIKITELEESEPFQSFIIKY